MRFGAIQTPNIVNPFKNNQITRTRCGKYVTIETRKHAGAQSVCEHSIPTDTPVDHTEMYLGQSRLEVIRPSIVRTGRGCVAIRNRIAESDDGAGIRNPLHLYTSQKVPM